MYRIIILMASILLLNSAPVNATVVYDTWTSVNGPGGGGNYILTVNSDVPNNAFDINLTVNPWNAEALGLFIDLGNFNLPGATLAQKTTALGLTNISPVGQVALFAADTTSNTCGPGCNLNGFNPVIPSPDGEWELVFRLGTQGYNNIQTFSFQINNLGLTEAAFGLVGIRAQVLCSGTDLLPDDNDTCGGSDKSAGTGSTSTSSSSSTSGGGDPVPEPSSLVLLGLGLIASVFSLRRSSLQGLQA
jgi:hypothetical protein